MSNIFLNESFVKSTKDIATKLVKNNNVISYIKKHYSGKDDNDITKFSEELKNATTKTEIKYVIDEIEYSLSMLEAFKNSARNNQIVSHMTSGRSLLAAETYKEQGLSKSDLVKHETKLKSLLSQAKAKLSKVK